MKQIPRIVFNSKEEKTQFNQIIISSESAEDAINKVKDVFAIPFSLASTAVNIFWAKRESYIKRFT